MSINLKKLAIRKVEDNDTDYLLKMVRRVTTEENVKFLCADVVNEYIESGNCDKAVLDSIDSTQLLVYEDRIIGYAAWKENYLEALMIDNECYGTGAASWFMERMQDELFMKYDVLTLDVFEQNERALKFYRKIGWHVYGYHIQDVIGVKLWDLCLIKDDRVRADKLSYRNETISDYWMVENLTREAFWNIHAPGCDEHYLMHIVRDSKSFVEELDMVAETNGYVVGNIVYTKARIVEDCGKQLEVLCFGPLSILPNYHGRGIGAKLIEVTVEKARDMGYKAVLIYGDPGYYSRFGFVPAENYHIGTSDNMYIDALQALELEEGALENRSGRFFIDDVFEIDEEDVADFDKGFPPMEKLSGLKSQKKFAEALENSKTRE